MNLIVPINLQGLRVSNNDAAKITNATAHFSGPTTSYHELPWRDANFNEIPGRLSKSNVSINIDNPLDETVAAQLDPGVHLHWALPDALTKGRTSGSGIEFPAAPNRWLVTRVMCHGGEVSSKQWIIESDRLMTEDEYTQVYFRNSRRKSVAMPVGWDIVAGTDPSAGGAVYYPPHRRVGRVFDLASWAPQVSPASSDPTLVLHLDALRLSASNLMAPGESPGPLRAVGPSGPMFSAYYPDCASVFGFHDTFDGIDLGNVAFDVSYSVIGWHASVDQDPLQSPDFLAAFAQAKANNDASPTSLRLGGSALRASVIEERYGWIFDESTGDPQRCLYAGQIVQLPWDTTGDRPNLGEPTLPQCYLVPPAKDQSVRIAVANSTSSALAALLQHELAQAPTGQPETTNQLSTTNISDLEFLLDALQLGLLDRLGTSYSMAELELTLNEHGFASRGGGRNWEIRAKSERSGTLEGPASPLPKDADDIPGKLDQLNKCQRRLDALILVLRSAQRQLFLDWYKFITAVFSPGGAGTSLVNPLRDYLSAQILDFWAKLEAAFGKKTAASATTRNIPVFYSGPDTYLRHCEDTGVYETDSPAESIAGQIVELANALIALLRDKHPSFELQTSSYARFWEPHDPIIVATGESLEPARRNGNIGALPCRVSAQIVKSLNTSVPGAKSSLSGADAGALLGLHAPNLSKDTTAEGKATGPLASDMAALLGEFALLDSGAASKLAGKLSVSGHQIPGADLHGAMLELAGKIAAAWTGGAASQGKTPAPAVLDDIEVSSGAVTAKWVGRMPQGLALTSQPSGWRDPFMPISFVWTARLTPFEKGVGASAANYAPSFITEQFALDENAVELDYGAKAPRPAGAITVSGAVPLSSKAAEPLLDKIRSYLEDPSDDAETLRNAVAYLGSKPFLSHGLDGVNAAMLGLETRLELRPFDPFYDSEPIATKLTSSSDNFAYQNCPTYFVAATAGNETALNPGAAELGYHPIRAGFLDIVTVDLVDVFGRKRRLIDTSTVADRAKIIAASTLQPGVHSEASADHQAYLTPRLAQSARLQFRWLAADSEQDLDAHAPTTPICGWIVPNHLDNSLALFSGEGDALGSLGVEGRQTKVTWRSPAGRELASIESDLAAANPTLRDLALSIHGKDVAFFAALNDAIENAHTYILPADKESALALTLLIGRPLAVVKASLRLELEGLPAFDNSDEALARALKANTGIYDWTTRSCAGLTSVKFPVRIGDRNHLEDGLVAYVLGDRGPFDAIYAPAARSMGSTGVVRPRADTISIQPHASLDPPAKPLTRVSDQINTLRDCTTVDLHRVLTLLVDPRAQVHAATGVLPVKAIDLPSEMYADALRKIEISFFTAPILRGRQNLELPLPDETGFLWGWTTGVLEAGVEKPNNEAISTTQMGDRAQFSYTPQIIEDGWLRLRKDEKT